MTSKQSDTLTDRARKIKLIAFDVDGVLTNGLMFFGPEGESLKTFHVRDGLGIALLHSADIKTAIITGRSSAMVKLRAAELKIDDIYQGTSDKVAAMEQLTTKYKLDLCEVCYVGDDLNDLSLLDKVGLACTVADAVDEVRSVSHFTASLSGGTGAVRQIIEMILKSQGKWDSTVAAYWRSGCRGHSQ